VNAFSVYNPAQADSRGKGRERGEEETRIRRAYAVPVRTPLISQFSSGSRLSVSLHRRARARAKNPDFRPSKSPVYDRSRMAYIDRAPAVLR